MATTAPAAAMRSDSSVSMVTMVRGLAPTERRSASSRRVPPDKAAGGDICQRGKGNCLIINLGGGVLTDLGGFVASTFMRGIRFVHIPTSLLGMVDAAIGGKTGVDFGGLKNMIGVFSRAESIIVDSNFLRTLPSQHYRNGLAEVLKHAFISDPELLVMMEENEDELIARSIQVKLDVVQRDELESGERKKLNFGHTIGHALESFLLDSDREVLHGEAVAAGMVALIVPEVVAVVAPMLTGLANDPLASDNCAVKTLPEV